MKYWPELGFRGNPYTTLPVPSSEDGDRLLVGRSSELERLLRTVTATATHAVVDGANGVGKSSLVAVAVFRLWQARRPRAMYLPLPAPLNVTEQSTHETIADQLMFGLAQALIDNEDDLRADGAEFGGLAELRRWLNSPLLKNRSAGASALGFGGSGALGESANTSVGFAQDGFRRQVWKAVEESFRPGDDGGFVVVLENVELAGGSLGALGLLEGCRDPLLTHPALKWIICGSGAVMRHISNSPRLDGVIGRPVTLTPLDASLVPEVVAARVSCFRTRQDPLVPVDGEALEYLFGVSHGNLRTALRYAEEFSAWAYLKDALPDEASLSRPRVAGWVRDRATEELMAVAGVSEAAWSVFDAIAAAAEPVEVASVDPAALEALEVNGLVRRSFVHDAADPTCEVSQSGWLAHEGRREAL
jgi:hypothetical protein